MATMQNSANYAQARHALIEQYRSTSPIRGIRRLIRGLTRLTDDVVQAAWQSSVTEHVPPTLLKHVCVLAVGGYGRGDLLPNSDVDVLVLIDDSGLADEQRGVLNLAIERWVGTLWDVGLAPSHGVRTIDECLAMCAEDLSTESAVLERRYLAGAPAVVSAFYKRFYAVFDLPTFWRNKVAEMRARYTRFELTPFSLEPNCKESPGGLRDLHLMLWLARAAHLSNTWHGLQDIGWLNARQVKLILKCETLLLAIRAHLHILTRRAENRLLFDLQSGLAEAFGLHDTEGKRASERLMQKYYIAASVNAVRMNLFLQKFEDFMGQGNEPHGMPRIEHKIKGFPDFVEVNHELDIVNPDVFAEKPHLMLDMFYVFGSRGGLTGCTPNLWDAVLKYRELIKPAFRRDPENRQRFLRILKLEKGITHTIRLMHQMGILSRYLPVFRKIVGQMQHDLFHIYTVDQHILMVVRNLRRFTMQEYMPQHELANQVMAEFGKPWLMYIAGLFHDVAKGRGGDHSTLGAVEVARFAKQHGLNKSQTNLVVFLVDAHLQMSQFAQKEDLTDPDVIVRFANIVKTPERLQALYLLTVADIRGTSPKVWNAWKDKLLADLYRATMRVLEGKNQRPRATLIKERQDRVRELIAQSVLDANNADYQLHMDELWQHFNTEYFIRHDTQTIAWHTRNILQSTRSDQCCAQNSAQNPSILVSSQQYVLGEDDNCVQLMVYTQDQPDLFARICAHIQQRGYSIFDAHIYTSAQGMALDTFQIILTDSDTIDEAFLKQLNEGMCESLEAANPLRTPSLGRLSARSRNFPVKPSMTLILTNNDEFLMKLTATDRPGVLYSIAYVFHEMDIKLRSARIATLGERLEDVFVIHSPQLNSPSFTAEFQHRVMTVCTI